MVSKTDKKVLEILKESGPLTLDNIAERLNMKPKLVFKSLRRLFQKGQVSSNPETRQYALCE